MGEECLNKHQPSKPERKQNLHFEIGVEKRLNSLHKIGTNESSEIKLYGAFF